ncbi:MAG: hypothetical protein R2706_15845 [Acidimicrobiales bacterium]
MVTVTDHSITTAGTDIVISLPSSARLLSDTSPICVAVADDGVLNITVSNDPRWFPC